MSTGIQPSADPLLTHSNVTSYYKSVISYAEACPQQVKKLSQSLMQRPSWFASGAW